VISFHHTLSYPAASAVTTQQPEGGKEKRKPPATFEFTVLYSCWLQRSYLLDEDLSQPALAKGVVLEVELVKPEATQTQAQIWDPRRCQSLKGPLEPWWWIFPLAMPLSVS
jgi:hypothetical protein